ncbi:snare-like protein [Cylindrobasidium torrendii FP15055 ss-10]|uniref:Trafficking protein particle complex subunit n=1 Tax=Cylindrobasidium torrendii FP15055 ss-10 TaxID=1314674 RepID=A0A0D7BRS1_9AGAR|nr:snare-like protein [Cylindrobasidium torrendii FP15055 ss-10]
MTIHSLYIFDRHCTCVYYQDWHRTRRPKPAAEGGLLPAVSQDVSAKSATGSNPNSNRNTLTSNTGIVVAVNEQPTPNQLLQTTGPPLTSTGLAFDEEAKLVYGVILSLRNMVRKLSGKDDEQFLGYRTNTYKLHLFETASGYKLVMLTDPNITDNLRLVLRQIYLGPFLEYVTRNPLSTMDSKEFGIDNEYFRQSIHNMVSGLTGFN